jgi:predicted phosphodiesterase
MNARTPTPLAVLADIHGNTPALNAVLADTTRRGVARLVNLGDTFYGPLDPGGTWEVLKDLDIPAVLGNQDRILLDAAGPMADQPAFGATRAALGPSGLAWLRRLPATRVVDEAVFLCHGTPADDTAYLLEDVSGGLPVQRPCTAMAADLAWVPPGCSLVLAGHSHHQGMTVCGGMTVVNPGSVGLPAYDDDAPPHAMASGSPHARYALVTPARQGWTVEFVRVEYDWRAAAELARMNGRPDWAQWLLTGRAEPPSL